jgi:AcrR family transcriptional regulator
MSSTVALLNEGGWSRLSLSAIARHSERSATTVAKRYATVVDAAAHCWRDHYGERLSAALEKLLLYAGLLEGPSVAKRFDEQLRSFARPHRDLSASIELLMVANFEEALRKEVGQLQEQVSTWCSPRRGAITATLAAQRAYLINLALGLVVLGRRPGFKGANLSERFSSLFAALQTPAPARRIPSLGGVMPLELDRFEVETGDEALNALLNGTLRVVANRGIDRATTQLIAEASGYSEGLLFARYRSKLDVFLDALRRFQSAFIAKQNAAAWRLANKHGAEVVDAAVFERSLTPERAGARMVAMEHERMSYYHPELAEQALRDFQSLVNTYATEAPGLSKAEVTSWVHFAVAVGAGMGILPLLSPEAHKLPFIVVLGSLR